MFNHLDERNKTGSKLRIGSVSNSVFDMETNFITCKCKKPTLYPKHLGDGGYDWCKKCDYPLGDD